MIKFNKLNTKSNYISLLRILLAIPIIYLLDYIENDYVYRLYLVGICLFAFVTDFLDGYLARKYNEVSELGKVIDPLADKLLVAILIIKLYLIGEISTFYLLVILLRDVIIFIGGIFTSRIIGKVLPSNLLGKITVLSIGTFILCIILNLEVHAAIIYNIFYYLSIILSIASIAGYGIRAYESIKWKKYETI
jgi:CDP-diacylglycerol--glycerol-3-phosphate 3-phosphatidyltransferase